MYLQKDVAESNTLLRKLTWNFVMTTKQGNMFSVFERILRIVFFWGNWPRVDSQLFKIILFANHFGLWSNHDPLSLSTAAPALLQFYFWIAGVVIIGKYTLVLNQLIQESKVAASTRANCISVLILHVLWSFFYCKLLCKVTIMHFLA